MADKPSPTGRFFVFGPFRFDTTRQQLYRDGQPVELTRRLERALQLLLENRGRDLEKSYLMEQLWPNTVVEENNLSVIISMLRKALGDDTEHKKFILTNPGRGYRFVADVTEIGGAENSATLAEQAVSAVRKFPGQTRLPPPIPLDPGPAHEERLVHPGPSSPPRKNWRHWVAIGAVLLSCAAGVGLHERGRRNSAPSIAVLPFQPVGAADDRELALGMADALIARLRNIRSVVVRPTADIVKYQNAAYDPIAVGNELNVVSLVDGTVERRGDQIWLRVKLLRVKDAAILWAGEYHGRFADLLAFQDQIAEQATHALALRLATVSQAPVLGHYSGNPGAHQAYMAGRDSCSHIGISRALERGVSYFRQATAKDPRFALAYADLAMCFVKLADVAEPSVRPGFLAEAKAAAEHSLEIDSTLQEAYLPLAMARVYYDWAYAQAEVAFRKSIDLAPQAVAGHVEYATFLLSQGRFRQAESEARTAAALDPLSWSADTAVSTVYFYERRYAEAVDRWDKAREFAPDRAPAFLEWISVSQNWPNATGDELVSTQAGNSTNPRRAYYATELAYLLALRGRKLEAKNLLQRLEQYPDASNVDEYETSLVYVALGDADAAVAMLQRAKENRSNEIIFLNVDPRFDSIRSDIRFQELIRSLHLNH